MTSIPELYNHWRYGEQSRNRNRNAQGIMLTQHSNVMEAAADVISILPPDLPAIWGVDDRPTSMKV